MKPICHLVDSGAPSVFGIRTSSIPDDNLDAGWVRSHSAKTSGVRSLSRSVCGCYRIEQQRPVPTLFLIERDVINTQHARSTQFTFCWSIHAAGESNVSRLMGTPALRQPGTPSRMHASNDLHVRAGDATSVHSGLTEIVRSV